jgi:hypothetical protein
MATPGHPGPSRAKSPLWAERLGGYVRFSRPERREVHLELTKAEEQGGLGLTLREAAQVTGYTHDTVWHDVRNWTHDDDDGRPGLSQRDAAAVLNVDQATVSRDANASNGAVAQGGTGDGDANASPKPHIAQNSGEDDWCTPACWNVDHKPSSAI